MLTICKKLLIFGLLMIVVGACENPQDDTPTVPSPAADDIPAGDDVPAETPFVVPPSAELDSLATALESNRGADGERAIPLPPAAAENLAGILGELAGSELLLLTHAGFPTIFNLEKTTTFTLPEVGTLYQLASVLPADLSPSSDELLADLSSWGGLLLPIGGLVAYQAVDNVPAGIYLVLLHESGTFYLVNSAGVSEFRDMADGGFGEIIAPVISGQWGLRVLEAEAVAPYSFVTYQQICFSQGKYQACLNQPAPKRALAAKYAQEAIDNLTATGLLPAGQSFHLESTFGDVQSPSTIDKCFELLNRAVIALLEATPPSTALECLPDFVVTAGDPFSELDVVAQAFPRLGKGAIAQATPTFASAGVGVIRVLQPISDGQVVDGSGAAVVLPAGDYRLDNFELSDGTEIGRLVSVSSQFYIELQEVNLDGTPETDHPEIILDATIMTYCSKYGKLASCADRIKKKVKICIGACTW